MKSTPAERQRFNCAILAAIGYTEPSTFDEFCRGLGADCPEKGDVPAWRELWEAVKGMQEAGWIIVKTDGRLTESLQLTNRGADYIRGVLDQQRGLLGLLS